MLDRKQLDAFAVCQPALELVPEAVAREHCVLAVSESGDNLHLVLPANIGELVSTDETGLDRLRFILDREFTHDMALRDELYPVVDLHYRTVYSDIRNCNIQFQTRCPKQWADLLPTDENTVRYCNECEQNVYFCHSSEELKRRTANHQCVAFCDTETHSAILGLLIEIPDS